MTMIVKRPLVKQEFTTFGLTVGTSAGPINANMGLQSMIDAIIISVPASAANNIFLGADAGVTTTTGIEIVAGSPVLFAIDHDGRQLYELQEPLVAIASIQTCRERIPEAIPYVLWDISQMYLVAGAATNIAVGVFKAMYI